MLPGESRETARAIFAETIRSAAASDPWLKENPPELEWFEGQFESGETDMDDPIIELLGRSHREIVGKEAQIEGVPYGSDLRLFTNHGQMPAILYGPGDVANAHSVNEFVPLDEVIACTKILALTIYRTCGGGGL